MKTVKITNWISTGLLTALMLMSAGMYLFNNAEISLVYTKLGFPTYIIYPLAFLKISGLIVIWVNKWNALKEWAYAGYFFNVILAFFAHIMIEDGEFPGALIAFILVLTSYFSWKKLKAA